MQIAVVAPFLPRESLSPERERALRLSEALGGVGQVHLFAGVRLEDMAYSADLCGRTFSPYSRVVSVVGCTLPEHQLASAPPSTTQGVFENHLRKALAAAHEAQPFDTVVLFGSETIPTVSGLRKAVVVLDEPRLRSRAALMAAQKPTALMRNLRHWSAWQQLQREAWGRADVVTVPTERDAHVVHQVRPDTGQVIPQGVNTHAYRFIPPSKRRGNTILFSGDMSSPTIRYLARVLVAQILPLVVRKIPDASVTIAGSSIPPSIRALEGDSVRIAGSVLDLIPLLEDHAVYVVPPGPVPISVSDVLGAMAAGMPVVAPATSVPGTGLEPGKHYVRTATFEMAARGLIEVLDDRRAFDEMARQARRRSEALHWDRVSETFSHLVMAATHRRHG